MSWYANVMRVVGQQAGIPASEPLPSSWGQIQKRLQQPAPGVAQAGGRQTLSNVIAQRGRVAPQAPVVAPQVNRSPLVQPQQPYDVIGTPKPPTGMIQQPPAARIVEPLKPVSPIMQAPKQIAPMAPMKPVGF